MKKTVVVLIVVLVVLLCGGATLYSLLKADVEPEVPITGTKTQAAEQAGGGGAQAEDASKAPDFKIYDEDGVQLTLADLEGKPSILNFWASWCGPCKSEMPLFDEMYQEFGSEVNFVMINLTDESETQETAMELIDKEGYGFPVYFDLDRTVQEAYQAYSIPVTYFLDEDGNIVAYANGTLNEDSFTKGLKMIIK